MSEALGPTDPLDAATAPDCDWWNVEVRLADAPAVEYGLARFVLLLCPDFSFRVGTAGTVICCGGSRGSAGTAGILNTGVGSGTSPIMPDLAPDREVSVDIGVGLCFDWRDCGAHAVSATADAPIVEVLPDETV